MIFRWLLIIFCILISVSGQGFSASISGESVVSGETRLPPKKVLEKPGEKVGAFIPILPPLLGETSDSDIDTFTTRYIGLQDPGYIPPDLEPIGGPVTIGEAGRTSSLRREARESLWKMSEDFYREFDTPLIVVSGYRSAAYQQRLWDLGRCTATLCAPPGFSEHQLGLAIDIFDASTEAEYYKNTRYKRYIEWFRKNAHLYGWHQSYQKGEYIDGYGIEPWHWRYLGIPLATKLEALNMTYTEYIRFERVMEYWRR